MAGAAVRISFLADAGPARKGLEDLAKTAETSSNRASTALDGVGRSVGRVDDNLPKARKSMDEFGESTDQTATKTGIMASALGAFAGGIDAFIPGAGKYVSALEGAAVGVDVFSNASDVATLFLQSKYVALVKDKVATVASTVASTAHSVATKSAAAAQWLLNAAMSANPIGLVVIAIAALVAGLIIAYKKSETFRNIVTTAFGAVKNAAVFAFNWVKSNWPLLLAIITGPIGLAVLVISRHWGSIKAGATAVFTWVSGKFNSLVTFVTGLPGRISSAASGMFDGIKSAFRSAINWVIDRWNGLSFSIPGVDTHIPGVGKIGGFTLSTPNIPKFHTGGVVPGRPGQEILALVQAGETITPAGKSAAQPVININVYALADGPDVGRRVVDAIKGYEQFNGAGWRK